jgi:hypothetical protein
MTALDFRLGGKVGNYLLSTLMRKFRGQSTGFAPASSDSDHTSDDHEHDRGVAKIERHFGPLIWQKFAGKRVLDFGCGWGFETIAVAEKGAAVSYGLDDQQIHVDHGNKLAQERGVANTCRFINSAATGNELHSLYGSNTILSPNRYWRKCTRCWPRVGALWRRLAGHGFILTALTCKR